MRQLEAYHDSYNQLLYAPVIRNLGVMNQILIECSINFGWIDEIHQLQRIDKHLVGLLSRKDIEPDMDWDDIWSYDNRDKFEYHYDTHRKDFGAKNWNDYAKQSKDFYEKAQKEKLPTVETNKGYTKIYDPTTKTFGTYNPAGKTETFYKPTSPTYFERQVDKEISKGGTIINPLPPKITNEPITVRPPSSGGFGGGGGVGLDPFAKPVHIPKPTDSLPEE
jgi:hypothetical protein